ncbi:MAG: suppressor of fused domain protein [Pseudomonadota bacterium]
MLSKLKRLFGSGSREADATHHAYRRAVYESELGSPEHCFPDAVPGGIEILGFGRDFSVTDAEDEGYVLVTNGMSDRRMAIPPQAEGEVKRRAELMWYVREPTPDIVAAMRWLAQLPGIDKTWLGFGHRIPMPVPPLPGSDFRTYLLLTPIIAPDQRLAEQLSIAGEAVDILTVNLISDAEYRLIQQAGLDPFLDLLDDNDHPPIFDPGRASYVPAAPDRDAPPYAGHPSVKPRHVLCVLGGDRDLHRLRAAAQAAIAEFATGFSIDDDYWQEAPDGNMSRSFDVCWDRVEPNAWSQADADAVAAHQSVLYVLGPRMSRDDAVAVSMTALRLVGRLLDAGAVAIKGESAGIAHGLYRWRELVRQGAAVAEAGDAPARCRIGRLAFAKRPLSTTQVFESVGYHLVGLPDVQVPISRGSDTEAVAIMDGLADDIAVRGIAAALQAHGATLIADSGHDEDDFKFNPYGIVRLES